MAGRRRVSDEQRRSVVAAVSTITAGAPADWVSLHAEFALANASATVDTKSETRPVKLTVPPEALRNIASHQQWAAEHGQPWRRLIIDCQRSGRVSVCAVGVGASVLRRITWALCALAVVLVIAAGVVLICVA